MRALVKTGYLREDSEQVNTDPPLDSIFSSSAQLTAVAGASADMVIAFGVRSGQKVRREFGKVFGYDGSESKYKGRRCTSLEGFSLHANRYIGAGERKKLKELLSYGGRGAFSHKRLSLKNPHDPNGDLKYTLKSQWSDGTTAIYLTHSELIEKLVALIPPPYIHSSRYFGLLSSHSKWRKKIILKPEVKKGFVAVSGSAPEKMTWARLLARVFKIDIAKCSTCGKNLYPANFEVVTEPAFVAAILASLGLPALPPPRAPPRWRQVTLGICEEDMDQSQSQGVLEDL